MPLLQYIGVFFLGVFIMSIVGFIATFECDEQDVKNDNYVIAFGITTAASFAIIAAILWGIFKSDSGSGGSYRDSTLRGRGGSALEGYTLVAK